MIALLRGRLAEKHPNRVILDVQGVGYDLHIPLSTFYVLGEPGAEMVFRVYTHVREDTLALFGFATAVEQAIFEQLIGVSGIGPRLALAVLSGMESEDLIRAVRQGDVGRLTGIPGVGKKTAERIGLELKDRLPVSLGVEEDAGTGPMAGDARDDLLSALVNLGYHRSLAERAVDTALAAGDGVFEQVLKQALRELAR
ncbi:MAG: Holliday junction branch migration protein RuvA [Acidobacteriota bacterium]|nr:Holliday junction branch migration protein RuvA [Acidobacteriota bacterium]